MSKTYDKLHPDTNNDPEFEQALERSRQKTLEERKDKDAELDTLNTQFTSRKSSGLYNYIVEIDKKSLFFFSTIFLFIFSLVNKIYFSTSSIVAILIATLVVYFLNERRRTTDFSDMKELEIKLVRITPNPKYFHLDAGIIELVYSIREFRTYNNQAFVDMISAIDRFLALVYDIENDVADCHHAVQLAQSFKKQALNHLMSIIHRTPQSHIAQTKLRKATDSLHFIFNHHIDIISTDCNNKIDKEGLNVSNAKVYINQPLGFDKNFKNNFDLF